MSGQPFQNAGQSSASVEARMASGIGRRIGVRGYASDVAAARPRLARLCYRRATARCSSRESSRTAGQSRRK